MPVVHLAADVECHRGADARLGAEGSGLRVPQAGDDRRASADPYELPQDLRAVAGRTASRIVGHVGKHDRLAGSGEGLGHGLADGQRRVDELVTVLPGRLGDLVGEPLGQRLVVVGDHVDAEARVGNIREWKAGEDGDRDDLRVLFHIGGQVVEPPHRPARGALVAERRQERRLAQRGRGRQAPADDGDQLLGRLDGFSGGGAPLGGGRRFGRRPRRRSRGFQCSRSVGCVSIQ